MADRFDLEDKIHAAWVTSQDIDAIFEGLCNANIDQNFAENALMGLKVLHDLRMEQLWDTFKQVFQVDEYKDWNPLDYIKTKEDLEEYVQACQEEAK